ncbi:MAG: helix-turn-helix transcriptional regulator [Thermoanaerobaculia bacterium]
MADESPTSPAAPTPTTAAMDIQSLSRSCNEVLILSTLSSGPHHGYQLALEIEEKSGGAFRFKHGTLYPILHKLESDGLIRGDWLEEEGKRKRKRYQLTAAGRSRLSEQVVEWSEFFECFFNIVVES